MNSFKDEPMEPQFMEAMESAFSKIETGRLLSGRNEMFTVFNNCKDPLGKVFAAYNIGAVFWSYIGNGEKAREFYQLAVKEAEKTGIIKVDKVFLSMIANACENLMHLSLSYEEYFEWTDKLRKLQPTDDVLRGMVPQIREAQERGIPWSHTLESIAQQSYNRNDPSLDRGEYARAASTYHLILINLKVLRLPREAWSRIIYEYGTLVLRVASDARIKMESSHQSQDTKESTVLVQDAKLLVEEYFSTNPSDDNVQFLLDKMNGYIEDLDRFEKEQKVAFLNDQGTEYLKNRNFLSASSNFKKAEEISRSIGNQVLLQTCLGNLSIVAVNKGNPEDALKLITEKEEICRELDLFDKLINALLNKALILNVLNRINESLKLAEEANYLSIQHGFKQATEQAKQLIKMLQSKL